MENLEIEDKTEDERIERARKAVDGGASSISDVMRGTGISSIVLYRLEREGRIKLPRGKRGRKINETAFREAWEKKENSLEKLCKIGNFKSPHAMWTYCTKRNLPWPENPIPYRTWPEVDELIDEGLMEKEIGKKVDRSRELIRQYINASGQYDYWRGKREMLANGDKFSNPQGRIQLRSRFLSSFRARTEELAKKEDGATQKAVEYLHSLKVKREGELATYSFDTLYSIFKKYEEAHKEGKKLSLGELGKEIGFISPQVCKILARVGLEPMHRKHIMARKDKIDAVKRGLRLDLSSADVGYFLEHPQKNVARISYYMGGRGKTRFEIDKLGREYLTNRLASQIYEAQDASLNEDETAEYFGVSYDIVEYALTIRHEGIEKKLIKDLRILFNDKTIKTPYVTREMREKLEK